MEALNACRKLTAIGNTVFADKSFSSPFSTERFQSKDLSESNLVQSLNSPFFPPL